MLWGGAAVSRWVSVDQAYEHFGDDLAALAVVFAVFTALSAKVFRWE